MTNQQNTALSFPLQILGPVQVHGSDGTKALTPREQLVLAVLYCAGNRGVSVEMLLDLLWGAEVRSDTGSLRTLLTRLRRQLPAGIEIRHERQQYVLKADPELIDAMYFESVCTRSHEKADLLFALKKWRGPAAFGDIEGPGIEHERRRLGVLRRATILSICQDLEGDDVPDAWLVAEVVRLFEVDVVDEPVALALASLLSATGRRVEALRVLDRNKTALLRIGLQPGRRSITFGQHLLRDQDGLSRAVLPTGISIRSLPKTSRPALEETILEAMGEGPTLIIGPPGSGKSLLIDLLLERLAAQRSSRPTCRIVVSPEPSEAMQPIADLFRWIAETFPSWVAEWRLDPVINASWDRVLGLVHIEVALTRAEFLDALRNIVHRVMVRSGGMLIIDDAHQLDMNSLEVFRLVSKSFEADEQFQLVFTSRRDLRASAEMDSSITVVQVPPFDLNEVERCMNLAGIVAPLELLESTLQWTGGSPLFLSLVLEHLDDDQKARVLPDSVHRAVLDRLTGYPQRTRNALEYCALQGRSSQLKTIERILPTAVERLSEAVADGLVSIDGRVIVFLHELVADTIANSVSPGRRVQMSDQICDALTETGQAATLAARHALNSVALQPVRALTLCLEAAREEQDVFNWRAVEDWATRGLSIVNPSDASPEALGGTSQTVSELLHIRGRARRLDGIPGSERDLIDAAQLSMANDDRFASIVTDLCRHGPTGRDDAYQDATRSMLATALQRSLSGATRTALKAAATSALMLTSDDHLGRALYTEALQESGAPGFEHVRYEVLTNGLTGLRDPDDLVHYEDVVSALGQYSNPIAHWEAEQLRFARALRLADRERLDSSFNRLQELVGRVPRNIGRSLLRIQIAHLQVKGEIDAASALAGRLPGAQLDTGSLSELVVYVAAQGALWANDGRFRELAPFFRRLDAEMPWTWCWKAFLTTCHLGLPELDGSFPIVDDWPSNLDRIGRDFAWMPATCALARVSHTLDDKKLAAGLLDRLHPYGQQMIWTGIALQGPVADALSLCCQTLGDTARAAAYCRISERLTTDLNAAHLRFVPTNG